MTDAALPDALAEIRDEFLGLAESERLELLLEYAHDLPGLPARYADHPELTERVTECRSPVHIAVEVADDGTVAMFATAPEEAPTTRGFAGILVHGLTGLHADEVPAVPDDFAQGLGLARAVSPLRIAGMAGMLRRAKRQVELRRGR